MKTIITPFILLLLCFLHQETYAQFSFKEHEIVDNTYDIYFADFVYAEDFDNDGDKDLLLSYLSEINSLYTILWCENTDGKGNFIARQVITTNIDNPRSICIADMDGDGDMDVVSASSDDNKIAWYENTDSKGKFGNQQIITINANNVNSVYATDIDGDGNIDILATLSSLDNSIVWYKNKGKGKFKLNPIPISGNLMPESTQILDIDGDGDMDVLSVLFHRISIFKNNGKGKFSEPYIISNKNKDNTIHTEDIDKDGDIDILTYSIVQDKVYWHENIDGKGNFNPKQLLITTTYGISQISTADMDGDGDMDLLSITKESKILSWYENIDGKGVFGNQKVIATNSESMTSIYAVDLDGNTSIDILTSAFRNGFIWYKNTSGKILVKISALKTKNPKSVYTTDLDGDKDIDILYASSEGNTIGWYENYDGDGSLKPSQIIASNVEGINLVHATDIDKDGAVDVVFASYTKNKSNISYIRNSIDKGYLEKHHIITTESERINIIKSIDLDSDNDMDLLYSLQSGELVWLQNKDRKGDFGTPQVIATNLSYNISIYTTDLDEDGDIDIIVNSGDRIVWYKNTNGKGSFSSELIIGEEPYGSGNSIEILDIDGDLDLDVLISDGNNIIWYEHINNKDSFKVKHISSSLKLTSATTFDIDKDGDKDILAVDSNDKSIIWYENIDSKSSFSDAPKTLVANILCGVESIFISDINNDSIQDILYQTYCKDIIWCKIENNINFAEQAVINNSIKPQSAYITDIDNDGDVDIVSVASESIAWYKNTDGKGNFNSKSIKPFKAKKKKSVLAIDIDNDGDIDILSNSEGSLIWYENIDGKGDFAKQHIISTQIGEDSSVFAADLDGDKNIDIISSFLKYSNDNIVWFKNLDGKGNFSEQQSIVNDDNYLNKRSIYVSDLDGDGDNDLLSASLQDGVISWYENNNGKGVFSSQKIIANEKYGATFVSAIDMDNDGDMDVLSSFDYFANKTVWYENIDGKGNFLKEQTITSKSEDLDSICTIDFDGDDDIDVLGIDFNTKKVVWYENIDSRGGFKTQQEIVKNTKNTNLFYTTDIDGDGDIDMLFISPLDRTIFWLENLK